MLRDIFWLSTGQAIAITNKQKNQSVDVRDVVAVEDGLIITYLPNSEATAESFRALVKARIAANSEAQGIISVSDHELNDSVRRAGSVH